MHHRVTFPFFLDANPYVDLASTSAATADTAAAAAATASATAAVPMAEGTASDGAQTSPVGLAASTTATATPSVSSFSTLIAQVDSASLASATASPSSSSASAAAASAFSDVSLSSSPPSFSSPASTAQAIVNGFDWPTDKFIDPLGVSASTASTSSAGAAAAASGAGSTAGTGVHGGKAQSTSSSSGVPFEHRRDVAVCLPSHCFRKSMSRVIHWSDCHDLSTTLVVHTVLVIHLFSSPHGMHSDGSRFSSCAPSNGSHQRSEQQDPTPARPYVYELFAVLVHSGSALGGHYYAYIKVLDDPDGEPRWLKFNDSTVTTVTTATVAADGLVFFSRVFRTRITVCPMRRYNSSRLNIV